MKTTPTLRAASWMVVAACWAGATGCTHNHYYGAVPACGPTGQAITTQVGPVCEVPNDSGTIASSGGPSSGFVVQTNPSNPLAGLVPNPQKVVISQPASGPAFARNSGRFTKWRRPDPEGLATIRTEGGLSDDTIQR